MKKLVYAEDTIGSYSVVSSSDNEWYIVQTENNEVVDGPFDSEQEALSYLDDTEEIDFNEFNNAIHEHYLRQFSNYARKVMNRNPYLYNSSYGVSSRSIKVLPNLVKRFNRIYPEADLEVDYVLDSEGYLYFVN